MDQKHPRLYTLLPNVVKKKDKEDYTTIVAQHILATDVVQSSLSFFFTIQQGSLGYFYKKATCNACLEMQLSSQKVACSSKVKKQYLLQQTSHLACNLYTPYSLQVMAKSTHKMEYWKVTTIHVLGRGYDLCFQSWLACGYNPEMAPLQQQSIRLTCRMFICALWF